MSDPILRTLDEIGYRTPTPIQSQAIGPLLAGRDLLGIAQTGTGKTAAFALPLLERLAQTGTAALPRCPRALVLAPTRELAQQIHEQIEGFSRHLALSHAVVFGGVGQRPQVRALARGVDLLVATPGRLLDLMGQGHADLSRVSILVLDEADRLLDLGFIGDVRQLVMRTPAGRQSLMFSATMAKGVTALAGEMLRNPIRIDVSPKAVTVDRVEQRLIEARVGDKRWVLEHLLRESGVSRAMVFTRTKHGATRVAKQLLSSGISAEALHGDMSQAARQRALQNFKEGPAWVLVATDVAARGIDVQAVSHVINYELPDEPENYVHRIGRTARAGAGGVAWSLYDPAEAKRLRSIERLVGRIPTETEAALRESEPVRRPKPVTAPARVRGRGKATAGAIRRPGAVKKTDKQHRRAAPAPKPGGNAAGRRGRSGSRRGGSG